MRESLKDLAVASALVVGLLPANDTNVNAHKDIYAVVGVFLIVFWVILKLCDLFQGDSE